MLPEAFLNRMQKQLGQEFPDFLESLERPRAVAGRLLRSQIYLHWRMRGEYYAA